MQIVIIILISVSNHALSHFLAKIINVNQVAVLVLLIQLLKFVNLNAHKGTLLSSLNISALFLVNLSMPFTRNQPVLLIVRVLKIMLSTYTKKLYLILVLTNA